MSTHRIYQPSIHTDDGSDLVHQMFKDRTTVFRDRLGWDVSVNDAGEERDDYDTERARYMILSNASGEHIASCRLIPMTERVMIREAFSGLFNDSMGRDVHLGIEVTRFCVMTSDVDDIVKLLFLESAHWLKRTPFTSFFGVFYAPMLRIYKRSGWPPTVLNKKDRLYAGQWHEDDYGDQWQLYPPYQSSSDER